MRARKSFSNTVVVVGATGMDDIARPLHALRTGASNPVCWQHFAGGVATNVARGISRDFIAHLITVIGNDPKGQSVVSKLSDTGIHVVPFSGPNCSTGSYVAVLDERGELFVGLSDFESVERLTWRHVFDRLPPSMQSDQPDSTVHAVVLDANLSRRCITDTVNGLSESGTRVFALTVSPVKSIRWLPVAHRVHVLFCNRAEAAALTSLPVSSPLERLADGLMEEGFRQFVVSDGGSPALVQENECLERDTEYQLEVLTTSVERNWVSVLDVADEAETLSTVNGAGDAMAAATIAHYLKQPECTLADSLTIGGMPAAARILSGEHSPLPVD